MHGAIVSARFSNISYNVPHNCVYKTMLLRAISLFVKYSRQVRIICGLLETTCMIGVYKNIMQGKNSHACKASQILLKTQPLAATATFDYFTRAEDPGLESFPQTVVSQLKITVSKTQHKNIQIKKISVRRSCRAWTFAYSTKAYNPWILFLECLWDFCKTLNGA